MRALVWGGPVCMRLPGVWNPSWLRVSLLGSPPRCGSQREESVEDVRRLRLMPRRRALESCVLFLAGLGVSPVKPSTLNADSYDVICELEGVDGALVWLLCLWQVCGRRGAACAATERRRAGLCGLSGARAPPKAGAKPRPGTEAQVSGHLQACQQRRPSQGPSPASLRRCSLSGQ